LKNFHKSAPQGKYLSQKQFLLALLYTSNTLILKHIFCIVYILAFAIIGGLASKVMTIRGNMDRLLKGGKAKNCLRNFFNALLLNTGCQQPYTGGSYEFV